MLKIAFQSLDQIALFFPIIGNEGIQILPEVALGHVGVGDLGEEAKGSQFIIGHHRLILEHGHAAAQGREGLLIGRIGFLHHFFDGADPHGKTAFELLSAQQGHDLFQRGKWDPGVFLSLQDGQENDGVTFVVHQAGQAGLIKYVTDGFLERMVEVD